MLSLGKPEEAGGKKKCNAVRKELREEEEMKNKPQKQRTVMSHVEVNSVEQRERENDRYTQ